MRLTGVDGSPTAVGQIFRSCLLCSWVLIGHLPTSVRETANVVRRFLVERACTRIDKNLCVQAWSAHLMEVDLSTLSFEQVGAIHGRITRSVEGFIQFLRISFHDFIPAIFTGTHRADRRLQWPTPRPRW